MLTISLASEEDRSALYALRHDVYAKELGQHAENDARELRDALDDDNDYLVAKARGEIAGFISITPPRRGKYSIDKYLRRDELPFAVDDGTYELRILTVVPEHRGGPAALFLMYAAFRWVEANGGTRVVALGRREIRDLYRKAGLRAFGGEIEAGAVRYVLMSEEVAAIRALVAGGGFDALIDRMEVDASWKLPIPFRKPADCFHGGAFFSAIGDEFDHLERTATIINADVLDAWFPPSPRVLEALRKQLPWLLRTSPPTGCEGMIRAIARARGVAPRNILPGAGSSNLIFLALREWLTRASQVLLLEPTYGEYGHVLENVIGCRAHRFVLTRENDYRVDLDRLAATAADYDLIILVNPNSPTGQHLGRRELESFLRGVPAKTLVWIDETYVDYAGDDESLEHFAVTRPNVVICKSMSKVYALSGARAAYLCTSPHLLERLRSLTPPWAVSLTAQVAAVAALQDPGYYAGRHRETRALRAELVDALATRFELDVVPSVANFVLAHLPEDGPTAGEVAAACRARELFIRDASTMGASLGTRAIRLAVKDGETNGRMVGILAEVLTERAVPRPWRDLSPRAQSRRPAANSLAARVQ